MKKQDLVKLITLAALMLIAYIPTIIWMWNRWNETDTYYSHGILVPFICGFLVWHKRKKLSGITLQPSPLGWLLFIAGVMIHGASALLQVYFTSGLSLVLVVAGLVLLFFSKEHLKQLWFPIAFILFMIPLPMVAIANMSFRLKIFAAQVATKMVNMIGVPAMRDGSIIATRHAYLAVEDPCSGIRSLIALIALGSLMAYLSKVSNVKKMIIFASAIPIAVGTNVIRIVALTLASEIYGSKFAMGKFHDTMGVLVFVLAFLGLALVSKVLE